MSVHVACRANQFALVSTASVVKPSETDAAKVETGATFYGNYCSSCHGEGLQNTSGGGLRPAATAPRGP